MTYKTIFTDVGRQALAQALAQGTQLRFAAMAVGDGNGNETTPDPEQTQLIREQHRAPISQAYRDPKNPGQFVIELRIPADIAGFKVTELGVFDDNGTLVAVGNCPTFYKPVATEGAYADSYIRLYLTTANADAIQVFVDPNVAVATQQWVSNNVTFGRLVPGGTTNQVLAKRSNADGDVEWVDPSVAEIVVDVLEEKQTLAEDQTEVELALCTTYGLALYVGDERGERLPPDAWTPHPTDNTKLTLGQSYPAGTMLIAAQNEPHSRIPKPLEQSKNLSDVPDAAAARQNLGVHSRSEIDNLIPAGTIQMSARQTPTPGWFLCDGSQLSRLQFKVLFDAIGTAFGAGDGNTTFNLPDMRGMFARGADNGRGVDPGRSRGSYQPDSLKEHQHVFGGDDQLEDYGNWQQATGGFPYDARSNYGGAGKNYRTRTDPLYPMAHETRPKNVAINYFIKY